MKYFIFLLIQEILFIKNEGKNRLVIYMKVFGFFIDSQLDFRVLISILFLSSSALGSICLSSV